MIGASLYSLLSGHAPLVALVGSKIYPVQAPQGVEEPAVIYGIIDQDPQHSKDRASLEDWIKVGIEVYAKDYDQMHSIAKEVRAALDRSNGSIAGNEISMITFEGYKDGWEPQRESYAGDLTFQVISTP
jgi:hypothetical protein